MLDWGGTRILAFLEGGKPSTGGTICLGGNSNLNDSFIQNGCFRQTRSFEFQNFLLAASHGGRTNGCLYDLEVTDWQPCFQMVQ